MTSERSRFDDSFGSGTTNANTGLGGGDHHERRLCVVGGVGAERRALRGGRLGRRDGGVALDQLTRARRPRRSARRRLRERAASRRSLSRPPRWWPRSARTRTAATAEARHSPCSGTRSALARRRRRRRRRRTRAAATAVLAPRLAGGASPWPLLATAGRDGDIAAHDLRKLSARRARRPVCCGAARRVDASRPRRRSRRSPS